MNIFINHKMYIENKRNISFTLAFGGGLLVFIFFMLLFCGISFYLDITVNYLLVPISFLLAFCFVYIFLAKGKTFLAVVATATIVTVFSAVFCSYIYDNSYDSNYYHNNIIVMIADGWNPMQEGPWDGNLWARHYAKGLEMIQAVMLAFSGNLQSTKCVNFLFAISAVSLAWHAIGESFSSINNRWKMIIAFMLIANPVLICQLTTSYNDYMLWLETVILVSSCLMIWKDGNNSIGYIFLFIILTIATNSKFTHIYYLGMECLFFAAWCICAKRFDIILRGVTAVVAALIVGILVIGFNPYITNTLGYGNPAYPLIGGDVDIMTSNTPDYFIGNNRFVNFFKSLFSVGSSEWGLLRGSFSIDDFLRSYTYTTRVNGFGIMMTPMLVLGIILMVLNKASYKWWLIWFYCLALSFSFEQTWWARYVPFLWALVVIPIIYCASSKDIVICHQKWISRIVAYSILIIAFANASLAIASSFYARYSYSSYINYIIQAQKLSGEPIRIANINHSFRQIFDEKGVVYKECGMEDLEGDTNQLFIIYELLGGEIVAELPMCNYPKLYESPKTPRERLVNYPKRKYNNSLPTNQDETK